VEHVFGEMKMRMGNEILRVPSVTAGAGQKYRVGTTITCSEKPSLHYKGTSNNPILSDFWLVVKHFQRRISPNGGKPVLFRP
jgi:hypothetical protein